MKNGCVALGGWLVTTGRGFGFGAGARGRGFGLVRPLQMSSINLPSLSRVLSSPTYLITTSFLLSFLAFRPRLLSLLPCLFGSGCSGCFPTGDSNNFPFGLSLNVRCLSGYRFSGVLSSVPLTSGAEAFGASCNSAAVPSTVGAGTFGSVACDSAVGKWVVDVGSMLLYAGTELTIVLCLSGASDVPIAMPDSCWSVLLRFLRSELGSCLRLTIDGSSSCSGCCPSRLAISCPATWAPFWGCSFEGVSFVTFVGCEVDLAKIPDSVQIQDEPE